MVILASLFINLRDGSSAEDLAYSQERKNTLLKVNEHWQCCWAPDHEVSEILRFTIQENSLSHLGIGARAAGQVKKR